MLEKDGLLSKQGRWARFKNQKERDRWLKEEISSLAQLVESQDSQVRELHVDLNQTRAHSRAVQDEIQQTKERISRRRLDIDQLQEECDQARSERNKLDEKRK